MSISKNRLIFDPTDVADSDSIGAYMRSADGTLITHTNNGGKDAMDVNIAASSTGIKIVDAGGDELEIEADGSINVNATIASPMKFRQDGTVVEVVEDTVTPTNNQPLPVKLVSASGDINITANDLNVQLSHTGANADSTKIGDGTTTVGMSTNGSMKVTDRADVGFVASAVAVDTTAGGTQLVSSALSERRYIEIQNVGTKDIYIGLTGVTAGSGFCVPRGASWSSNIGAGVDVYAISSAGSQDVRILEMS